MVAPEKEVAIVGQTRQHEAAQWRACEVEARGDVFRTHALDRRTLLRRREIAPVLFTPRQLRPLEDHLDGMRETFPEERRPEDVVARDDARPGVAERANVERLFDDEAELLEVDRAGRVVEAMEEHAGLHRRQLVDVDRRRAALLRDALEE